MHGKLQFGLDELDREPWSCGNAVCRSGYRNSRSESWLPWQAQPVARRLQDQSQRGEADSAGSRGRSEPDSTAGRRGAGQNDETPVGEQAGPQFLHLDVRSLEHCREPYGQLVVYYRANNPVPPDSRR